MSHTPKLVELANVITKLLDDYGPPGSRGSTRVFRWLSDADLKTIVQRDYAELESVLVPDGAWKSAVVMAGSILEAILVDLLTKDQTPLAAAKASAKAPKDNKGATKPESDWTLHHLIEIATDTKLIPADRAKTFDQVLRDYRNFVHARKETRAAHPCGEGERQWPRAPSMPCPTTSIARCLDCKWASHLTERPTRRVARRHVRDRRQLGGL